MRESCLRNWGSAGEGLFFIKFVKWISTFCNVYLILYKF